MLETNLRPYFFTAQAVTPGMRAAGRGAIINLGSNSANLGLAGYPAYVAAKSAIVGLTRALARELGVHSIRVNSLIPGWVMTERQRAMWVTPESLEHCLAEQSLKSEIVGEDVADAALFLASSSARMIRATPCSSMAAARCCESRATAQRMLDSVRAISMINET